MTYIKKKVLSESEEEEEEKKGEDKTDFITVDMSTASTTTTTEKPSFVPPASIVAFVFIGVIVLVGLVARCLALNNSTIRSAQSLDLMIYQEAPKPAPIAKARRLSIEHHSESNGNTRDRKVPTEDSVAPARIQRGPKNL